MLDAYLLALQTGDCSTTQEYAVDQFRTDGDLCGKANVLSYRNDSYHVQRAVDEVVLADTLTARGGSARPAPDPEPASHWTERGGPLTRPR